MTQEGTGVIAVSNVLVAREAFAHFRKGAETGEWAPFLAMMTEDYEFTYPVPGPFHGVLKGKEAVFAYLENLSAGEGLRVAEVYRETADDKTTVFEFEVQGTANRKPFRTTIAQSYDVSGNQIIAHREYIGDIAPFLPLLRAAEVANL